ncbi:hypothetical protein C8Q78DRAFT_1078716 [Trametes maxima]|nr:hypothetical protein C8Q78DRAFT_1078716 [Trametes maxima]
MHSARAASDSQKEDAPVRTSRGPRKLVFRYTGRDSDRRILDDPLSIPSDEFSQEGSNGPESPMDEEGHRRIRDFVATFDSDPSQSIGLASLATGATSEVESLDKRISKLTQRVQDLEEKNREMELTVAMLLRGQRGSKQSALEERLEWLERQVRQLDGEMSSFQGGEETQHELYQLYNEE